MDDQRRPDGAVRLIACDLDGTLLDERGVGEPGVAAALAQVGVPLVICTGRPHGAARRLSAAAGLRPAIIASYHGGLVMDERDGAVLRSLTLSGLHGRGSK